MYFLLPCRQRACRDRCSRRPAVRHLPRRTRPWRARRTSYRRYEINLLSGSVYNEQTWLTADHAKATARVERIIRQRLFNNRCSLLWYFTI